MNNLFGYNDVAKTKNNHPQSSHESADRINELGDIKKLHVFALEAVNEFGGRKSRDIGVKVASKLTDLSNEQVKDVIKYSGMATKRMADLKRMKFIEADEKDRLFITDRGYNFLRNKL